MISTQTLIGPSRSHVGLKTRIAAWFNGEEIALVNEHRCPKCHLWSHEAPTTSWRHEDADADHSHGYHLEIKTCGNCGLESRWFDTGFMGVMGCADGEQHEHGAFWHHLPKDRR